MDRGVVAILLVLLLMAPLTGSIVEGDNYDYHSNEFIITNYGETTDVPLQKSIPWDVSIPWWETTMLDSNRDGVHDSLAGETGIVNLGISYSRDVKESDIESLSPVSYTHLTLPTILRV